VLLIAGVIIYQMATNGGDASVAGIISIIGGVFLSIFLAIILSILLGLLRHFFWRACALEGLGVRDSLARGFAMVRENWKSVGLMWLVMIWLGIVWALIGIILVLITLPIVAITAHAMKGEKEKFLTSGMNGYISKPINLEELIETIKPFRHAH